MEYKKSNILVRSFSYELLTEPEEPSSEVQVAMRKISLQGDENPTDGTNFEMMVPFEIIPEPVAFKTSGNVSQIVKTIGFFGEAQDIDPKELEKLSRPIMETIENLVFQTTLVAFGEGVNLNFVTENENEQDNDNK